MIGVCSSTLNGPMLTNSLEKKIEIAQDEDAKARKMVTHLASVVAKRPSQIPTVDSILRLLPEQRWTAETYMLAHRAASEIFEGHSVECVALGEELSDTPKTDARVHSVVVVGPCVVSIMIYVPRNRLFAFLVEEEEGAWLKDTLETTKHREKHIRGGRKILKTYDWLPNTHVGHLHVPSVCVGMMLTT
jgi:hypothetical protein